MNMKIPFLLLLVFLILPPPILSQEIAGPELPLPVRMELRRLEETYHVLDLAAEQIWPGWKGYKDVPFLLEFENGLRVLTGHSEPPKSFELLPDVKVAGKNVFADRSALTPIVLEEPLSGGGGIIHYGTIEGKPVQTVSISFSHHSSSGKEDPGQFKTEEQILLYIHELFHCFQRDNIRTEYGNLNYNPDTNYALYSEVEGLALEKAYDEHNAEKSKEYLKDFILARELKQRSMTGSQQNEEASDDVREGTAVYAEVRTLEILKKGYEANLSPSEDSYYGEFKDVDLLMKDYRERMKTSIRDTYESSMKCYQYGCFQALLLQRFFPGWQESFSSGSSYLYEEIRKRISLSSEDLHQAKKRLKKRYDLKEMHAHHRKAIEERNAAYEMIASRKGRTYIISFKDIGHYVTPAVSDEKHTPLRIGLINIFPDGIGTMKVNDIELIVHQKPVEINQLYYVRLVDPEWKNRTEPYSIKFQKKDENSVFHDVLISTPLFTLKAPKVAIKETHGRIKFSVLSRVRE